MTRSRSHPEDGVQDAIVTFIRTVAPHCLVFAAANASRRTETGRASNAVPGLTPGIPDLILIVPGEPARVAGIEVKAGRGKLSVPQEAMRDLFGHLGAPWAEARSIDDVRAFLAEVGVETREASRC